MRYQDEPIPYRLTPAGSRACVMAELAEQVRTVPATRVESAGERVAVVVPAEGAVS